MNCTNARVESNDGRMRKKGGSGGGEGITWVQSFDNGHILIGIWLGRLGAHVCLPH